MLPCVSHRISSLTTCPSVSDLPVASALWSRELKAGKCVFVVEVLAHRGPHAYRQLKSAQPVSLSVKLWTVTEQILMRQAGLKWVALEKELYRASCTRRSTPLHFCRRASQSCDFSPSVSRVLL